MAKPKTEDVKEKLPEVPEAVEDVTDVDVVTKEQLADVDQTLRSRTITESETIATEAKKAQASVRTLSEIIDDLSRPLPPRHLKKLTKGAAAGSTYIPWPVVGKYLDFFAPGWEKEVSVVEGPHGASVTVHLIIPTSDFGKVRRGAVGFEPHLTNAGKLTGFGGPSAIAERMANKRSAAEFGLGKYLYEK